MKLRLLNYIVCPICHSELTICVSQQTLDEIDEGELVCSHEHRFPIKRSIPIFASQIDDSQKQTQDSFGEKWSRFEAAAFEKSAMDFQFNWYIERYGWRNRENLSNFLSHRSYILDAGAGVGRAVGWYVEGAPEGEIFGIDISKRAIDVAYAHYGTLPNVHLLQADLTKLPFKENFFDFIASDGVLHHTPNTEKSFKYLTNFLQNDGQICFYVYKKKGPIREFCDDYIRSFTTQMTADECLSFSEAITKFGKSLSDLNVEIEIPEDIPILDIKAGRYNLQRWIYWNIFKCFWNDNASYDRNVATNFDWYHPKYAHRHTPEEVRQWIQDENLEMINFDVIESGISVRAAKPSSNKTSQHKK